MTTTKTIYVASRKSNLAMVQTEQVIGWLQELNPDVEFLIGQQDTIGDQVHDRHLSDLGATSPGVFSKSLEEALLNGSARVAVHCLKDMPTTLPPGLVLGAICKRESPEDAVIIHPKHKANGISKLNDLPEGSVIGTSSLRREALLLRQSPTFKIKTIRGNIQTRLAKLENADDYDAIVIAACGYRRVGLGDRLDEILPADSFGYSVGQASLGIECRADDHEVLEMVSKLQDELSAQACKAERSLLYHLEGGCQISMGVNTIVDSDTLTLTATVLSRDGKKSIQDSHSGPRDQAESIGKALATTFLVNDQARELLGDTTEKRAITYGSVEAPGDAAALARTQ
ncbi:hypothetical protein Poli38472_007704 [Pythium oligandrum]|uniref:hydroxymethylbilane synthase n=1 Tax=Pythium oligandrum TaxID=41045 RepID=A0A8K1CQN4_PYTOL|nr:hypothetical protein Poli38472_007704 [Pythium oligandrum]|eukprot:TMW68032.1 hypothetical protein Poli38472_007704 [Pythium oligandrum]